mmetsp:Transcript_29915/g.96538  ORF Transcript_29915/g.96538 Transcript_29915/m.96538 type:complete len:152 (-) Transcript_29915:721-1176(-)
MQAHKLRTVVALVAMGDLIGQLSADLIFDTAEAKVFEAYYCTLLSSLSKFPQVLRVLAPCSLLGVSGGLNALAPTRTTQDLATAALLLSVGAVAFASSVRAVDGLCGGEAVAQSLLLKWHLVIAVVFAISMTLQLSSLLSHPAAPGPSSRK